MKLYTEVLKKFLNECINIKPEPTAPNLDSIKIECTGKQIIFTKTNNRIYLTYITECSASPKEVFLINEGVLRGIVSTTANAVILIEDKQKHLLIKDGTDNTKYPIEDIRLFPIAPPSNKEEIKISKAALQHIQIAGKYISDNVKVDARNFVHIGSNGVFGSNGDIVYYHQCNNEYLPEVFFGADSLGILKPVDGATYNRHGNYDFFNFDGFSYGFIQSAITKPIPYLPVIQQDSDCRLTFLRDDFLNFCKRVKYITKQVAPICTFKNGIDVLELQHIDADFDRYVELKITSQATEPIEEFKFSLEQALTLLNSLPYEYLIFTRIGKHYKVTTPDDSEYIGIIVGQN